MTQPMVEAGRKTGTSKPPTAGFRIIQVLLGHAKLDTTARYTQVATNIIPQVMSPLDRLTPLRPKAGDPK